MKYLQTGKQKKIALIALIILCACFVFALIVLSQKESGKPLWLGKKSFYLFSPVIGLEARRAEGVVEAPVLPPKEGDPIPLDYGEAINVYKGRHFQFSGCNGTPGSMMIKKGTTVLLDNRDEKSITVRVGSTTHTLEAYGYKPILISEVGDLPIACNGGGAATLTVQP